MFDAPMVPEVPVSVHRYFTPLGRGSPPTTTEYSRCSPLVSSGGLEGRIWHGCRNDNTVPARPISTRWPLLVSYPTTSTLIGFTSEPFVSRSTFTCDVVIWLPTL